MALTGTALIDYEISNYLEDEFIYSYFFSYQEDPAFWLNRIFEFYPKMLPVPKSWTPFGWYQELTKYFNKEWLIKEIIVDGNFKLLDFLLTRGLKIPLKLWDFNEKNLSLLMWLDQRGLEVTDLQLYKFLTIREKYQDLDQVQEIDKVLNYFVDKNYKFSQVFIDTLYILELDLLVTKINRNYGAYFVNYIFSKKHKKLLYKHMEEIINGQIKRDQVDLLIKWQDGLKILLNGGWAPPDWIIKKIAKERYLEEKMEKILMIKN